MREYYVIKVDYYMGDEKGNEWTEPLYLYTMRNKAKVFVFEPELAVPHYDLKWFATEKEALDYIHAKRFDEPQCSFENARVERIEY